MIIHNPIWYTHNHISTFFHSLLKRLHDIFEAEVYNTACSFMMRSQWMQGSKAHVAKLYLSSLRR